ncbi:hypothetical protein OHA72_38305 [Dactylosporangium sp. NBC_01737]|nr:hypothetical protein OHA72_38305 [Dactylosporangium sp. NBC_01737]
MSIAPAPPPPAMSSGFTPYDVPQTADIPPPLPPSRALSVRPESAMPPRPPPP